MECAKRKNRQNRKKKCLVFLLALCLTVSGVFASPLACSTVEANEGEGDTWVENADGQGNGYWYHELEGGGIEITAFTQPESSVGQEGETSVDVTVPSTLDGKQVVRIGTQAFNGVASAYCRESIRKITVPGGVVSIGSRAFEGCAKMEACILPEGVVTIEDHAFADCSSLKSLILPESVATIEWAMLSGCSSLTEITLPRNLTNIGSEALVCEGLTAISVAEENPLYASQDGILYNKEKTSLLCCPGGKADGAFTIPANTKEIGDYAFAGCKNLTEIAITENVERIGNMAFWTVPLTKLTIPGNVKTIGENAFANGVALKEIILEEGIETIGSSAFDLAFSVTEEVSPVTIPASVTNIDGNVFSGCTQLQAIDVAEGSGHYASEDGVLYNKDKTTLIIYPAGKAGEAVIPASVIEIDTGIFSHCGKISAFTVDPGNLYYASEEGVLYNKDKTTLLLCPYAKMEPADVHINVPDTVTKIERFAFDINMVSHVTLHCYEGSPAQTYADEHGMKFEATRPASVLTITFDANGGTNAGAASVTVTEGKTFRDMGLELKEAVRTGYDFLGWYTEKTGGVEVNLDTMFTSSQTVYAHWEKSYDDSGDSGQPTPPASSGDSGQPTPPASSGDSGQPMPPASSDDSGQQEQTVKYTVTFHKNGGSKVSKASITVEKGQKIGKLPTAQKKGYTFEGWYTAKKGGTKITSSTKVTKNQTVYAHWKKVAKPKKAGKPSLKSQKSGQLTVSYKKISGAKGYEICYSAKKNFKGASKLTISKTKVTIKKLKKKTVYYVKVRAYKLDSAGGKVYGSYGSLQKLKTK